MTRWILFWSSIGLLFLSLALIFFYAPEERTQGMVQKIFYFHVSSAFAMYIGFILSGIFSLIYLWKRAIKWDQLGRAGVSVGLLFCTMVLLSGPIWAKPIWGAWWVWDPRLTTTLILWLIFFSIVLIRRFFDKDPRGAVFGSVLTLFGLLDIPLVFFSVHLWRGVHPAVLGEENNMPLEMKLTLIITNIAVLCFFGWLYWARYRIYHLEDSYWTQRLT